MKRKLSGTLCIILAAIFWGMQGLFSKSNSWGILSLIGVRSFFCTLIMGILRKSFRPRSTPGNWFAAAMIFFTAVTYVTATRLTTAANAVVLQYTMTIYILLFEWLLLKKRPKLLDVGTFLLLLLGIVLCMAGNMGQGRLAGDIFGLLSALFFSGVYLVIRRKDTTAGDYSYMGCSLMIIFLLAIPLDPDFDLEAKNVLSGAGMGICTGLGYHFFGQGLDRGVKPLTAAILSYIEPILNPLLVLILVGEVPAPVSVAGFFVVLITVVLYNILTIRGEKAAEKKDSKK